MAFEGFSVSVARVADVYLVEGDDDELVEVFVVGAKPARQEHVPGDVVDAEQSSMLLARGRAESVRHGAVETVVRVHGTHTHQRPRWTDSLQHAHVVHRPVQSLRHTVLRSEN